MCVLSLVSVDGSSISVACVVRKHSLWHGALPLPPHLHYCNEYLVQRWQDSRHSSSRVWCAAAGQQSETASDKFVALLFHFLVQFSELLMLKGVFFIYVCIYLFFYSKDNTTVHNLWNCGNKKRTVSGPARKIRWEKMRNCLQLPQQFIHFQTNDFFAVKHLE